MRQEAKTLFSQLPEAPGGGAVHGTGRTFAKQTTAQGLSEGG